jgi:hypothetical protein
MEATEGKAKKPPLESESGFNPRRGAAYGYQVGRRNSKHDFEAKMPPDTGTTTIPI